jgi:hypothetical protein
MPAFLALMQLRFGDAAKAIEKYRADRSEQLLQLNALGLQAKCQLLSGNPAAAETLEQGKALRDELGSQAPGYHRSMLLTMQLLSDVRALESTMNGSAGSSHALQVTRSAKHGATQLLRVANIVARERVEAYRLVGRLWWLLDKKKKAIRWWEKSLQEGERMGAHPDLARTHLEIAHRLRHAGKSVFTGALSAETSSAKAAELFAALGMDREKEEEILLPASLRGEDERLAIRSSAA